MFLELVFIIGKNNVLQDCEKETVLKSCNLAHVNTAQRVEENFGL